jgi:hypothetical protein
MEHQMSTRSPATASKRARTRTAAKAQRAKPAVVRSPKPAAEHVAAGTPAKSARRRQTSSKPADHVGNPSAPVQPTPGVEIPAAAFRAAVRAENPAAALHYDRKASGTHSASNNAFDFSSATANLQAYQARFLDMALANMQFAFEFAQRLAAIRSPFDIFGVTAEFTDKRIALLRKFA